MPTILVLDTETGGVDSARDSLLALGAVVWRDGEILDELALNLLHEPYVVTARALEINGIDLVAHSRTAEPPAMALDRFNAFLAKHFQDQLNQRAKLVLAGHNIGFDVRFLRQFYLGADAEFDEIFDRHTIDTASLLHYLALAGLVPDDLVGSDRAFRYFNVSFDPEERHTALGDARATARLLTELVERLRRQA